MPDFESAQPDDKQRRAVQLLRQLGVPGPITSPETLQVLRELATNNPNNVVRRRAVEALGELGDTSTETLQVLREGTEGPTG